ncbi:MAG TPA: hypothetical protein VJL58_04860, partial [Pyrinomonadaceae bacterium]|nr:hypothetical protein [Pyrinomonadaceae bacterium]
IVFAALYFGSEKEPKQLMRFAIPAPERTTFGDSSAISPDGRQIAFTAIGPAGESSLWIRSVDSMESREIAGTAGAVFPFWSPDSRFVAFFAVGKLKKVDSAGGMPQIISDAATDTRGGAWSKNGTLVFTPDIASPLHKIPASGGTSVAVTSLNAERGETSHRWPQFLPDGNRFLFFGRGDRKNLEGVFVGSLDSTETKQILQTEIMAVYAPPVADGPGHLLYVRSGSLVAQPFDTSKLELSGEPVTVAADVVNFSTEVGPTAYAAFSVSDNGHLLFRTGGDQTTRLAWFDRAGRGDAPITQPGIYREPRLSPDGRRVIYGQADGLSEDLQILDTVNGSGTRLTFDPARDVAGVWSPNGDTIAFASDRAGGALKIYRKPANGAGADEFVFAAAGNAVPDDWSPDGTTLLFDLDGGPATKNDLMMLAMPGGREAVPYLQTPASEFHARFSPDGRWVAYTSDELGKLQIFVQSFPAAGSGKWQISTGGGDHPQWSRDGKELFYMAPDRNLMVVPITSSGTFLAGKPSVLFETKIPLTSLLGDRNNFVVSPDGQRILINNLVDERNTKPLTLVLNWEAEKRK